MFKKYIILMMLIGFSFSIVQHLYAQEHEDEGFVVEEEAQEVQEVYKMEEEEEELIEEEEILAQFIIADVLTPNNVEPAIKFYIHSDIDRKFSGLITNLKLEKIYGVIQDDKIATIYFDYSYTSVRNRDNIILDKGKMTFMKFNSGKWFNEELSIYLMDKYAPLRKLPSAAPSPTGDSQNVP